MSRETTAVFDAAEAARKELRDDYLSAEHLLLALADRLGVGREELLAALREVRGSHRVTSQNPEEQFQALERYGRDLTQAARDGKIDPVIGRDDEIRRVIQVLSRRTKNNPILIGEPGVGQDRHRGGAGPAHRRRRRPRVAEAQAGRGPRPRRPWWPGPSTAASSRSA